MTRLLLIAYPATRFIALMRTEPAICGWGPKMGAYAFLIKAQANFTIISMMKLITTA
jgi:hypothetical protein